MFNAERAPGPRVRVAPNVAMFAYGGWNPHFGELLQAVYDSASDEGIVVEFDADEHPRRGEVRAGAAPLEAIRITIEVLAGVTTALQLGEIILGRVVPWIVKHRGESDEDVVVDIYDPDGEVITSVLVSRDGETGTWRGRSK